MSRTFLNRQYLNISTRVRLCHFIFDLNLVSSKKVKNTMKKRRNMISYWGRGTLLLPYTLSWYNKVGFDVHWNDIQCHKGYLRPAPLFLVYSQLASRRKQHERQNTPRFPARIWESSRVPARLPNKVIDRIFQKQPG